MMQIRLPVKFYTQIADLTAQEVTLIRSPPKWVGGVSGELMILEHYNPDDRWWIHKNHVGEHFKWFSQEPTLLGNVRQRYQIHYEQA